MFPESGKNNAFSRNHMPISRLNTMARLRKRIFPIRLKKEYINSEYANRLSHPSSTDVQALRFIQMIIFKFNSIHVSSALMLDIFKDLTLLIAGSLVNRSFQVRIGMDSSQVTVIICGVPQGTVLPLVLYNIYTAVIPFGDM